MLRFKDHVDKKIVPRVPEQHPPASVLVYAARNIMKPQFVVSESPDLLALLGHLNVLRKFAVTKVSRVLFWHKRFGDNPTDDVSLLSPAVLGQFEWARHRAPHYQQLYRQIVNTCYEVVCALSLGPTECSHAHVLGHPSYIPPWIPKYGLVKDANLFPWPVLR